MAYKNRPSSGAANHFRQNKSVFALTISLTECPTVKAVSRKITANDFLMSAPQAAVMGWPGVRGTSDEKRCAFNLSPWLLCNLLSHAGCQGIQQRRKRRLDLGIVDEHRSCHPVLGVDNDEHQKFRLVIAVRFHILAQLVQTLLTAIEEG